MSTAPQKLRHSFAAVIAGNFVSNGVGLGSQLVLMPVYVRAFGFEGFGLISFIYAVQLALDLGMGASVNRAVASASCQSSDRLFRTLSSFETVYVLAAIFVCVFADVVSTVVLNHWLRFTSLSPESAHAALYWATLVVGIRWTLFFYQNALRGLERQHTTNLISVAFTTVRTMAVFALVALDGRLDHLFMLLFASSVVEMAVYSFVMHRAANLPFGFRLDFAVLRENLRFALYMWVASVAATLLKQMDRILLAGLTTLELAGVFSVVQTAVQAAAGLVLPFTTAVYPRWTRLIARSECAELKQMVSAVSRAIAVLVATACIILVSVGQPLLAVVTGTTSYASELSAVLALLALATMLNAPMQVQLMLALASGRSNIPMVTNIVGIVILVPTMVVLIEHWGIYGAGISWAVFNLGYLALVPRWVMSGDCGLSVFDWYIRDTLMPAMIVVACLTPWILVATWFDVYWVYAGLIQVLVAVPIVWIWVRPIAGLNYGTPDR